MQHGVGQLVGVVKHVVILSIALGLKCVAWCNVVSFVVAGELAVNVVLREINGDRAQTGIRVVPLIASGWKEGT